MPFGWTSASSSASWRSRRPQQAIQELLPVPKDVQTLDEGIERTSKTTDFVLRCFAVEYGALPPLRVKSPSRLVERATGFEPATFSLATVPGGFRRVASGLLGMPLNGALHAL
jgi:hypothetical protein